MKYDYGALMDLARQQMAAQTQSNNDARNLVRESFNTQRGIVNLQTQDAARRAMAGRGIDVNSEYGQRYLSEVQGQRGDALAAQEAAALSRIRDTGNLNAILGLVGQMGSLASQQQRNQLEREQFEWQQDQARQQSRAAEMARQEANQRAAQQAARSQIETIRARVAAAEAANRTGSQVYSTPPTLSTSSVGARPGSGQGFGSLPGGVRGGGVLLGDPTPRSPVRSLFADQSITRLRDAIRNTGAQAPPSPGIGGESFTGAGVGIGPVSLPGMTGTRSYPGGWTPLSQQNSQNTPGGWQPLSQRTGPSSNPLGY